MVLADEKTRGTGTWLLIVAATVIFLALGLLWIMAKDSATSLPASIYSMPWS
jgi:hypothetical protein